MIEGILGTPNRRCTAPAVCALLAGCSLSLPGPGYQYACASNADCSGLGDGGAWLCTGGLCVPPPANGTGGSTPSTAASGGSSSGGTTGSSGGVSSSGVGGNGSSSGTSTGSSSSGGGSSGGSSSGSSNSCAALPASSWQSEHLLPGPGSPSDLQVGDVDGDGLDDLVTVNGNGNVSVYLSRGGGTFAPPVDALQAGTAASIWKVALGDFSGSGQTDVAAIVEEADTFYLQLASHGDGGFGSSALALLGDTTDVAGGTLPPGSTAAVAALPMPSGPAGVLFTIAGGDGLYLATDGGAATVFQDANLVNGFGPIAVAFLGGDGGPPAVIVGAFDASNGNSDNAVYILEQLSPGNFSPNPQILRGVVAPIAIAVGDFDRDGNPDLAVVSFNEALGAPDTVSLYKGNGQGGVDGNPMATLTTDPGANSIAVGDFDGDGWPDIAVNCSQHGNPSGYVDVFLNGGCAADLVAPTPPSPIRLPVPSSLAELVAAGHLTQAGGGEDVAIGDYLGPGVFRSFNSACTGSPPFVPRWDGGARLGGVGGVADVISADFNQDGLADLAIATGDGGFVLYGLDGGGYAAPVQVLPPAGAQQFGSEFAALLLNAGDYRSDGTVDLAGLLYLGVGPAGGYQVAVTYQLDGGFEMGLGAPASFLSLADGGSPLQLATLDAGGAGTLVFTRLGSNALQAVDLATNALPVVVASVTTGGLGLDALASGDFNGDGLPDLVVSGYNPATNYSDPQLFVLLGRGLSGGSPTFGAALALDAGPAIIALATADFDQDGNLDFAAASQGANSVDLYFGDGTGFTGPLPLSTGDAGPGAMVLADFNGDGLPDIAVLTPGQPSAVEVFYSRGCRSFTLASRLSAPGDGPGSLCTVADPAAVGGYALVVAVADGGTNLWVPGY